MPEWSIGSALETGEPKGPRGSNPLLPANIVTTLISHARFLGLVGVYAHLRYAAIISDPKMIVNQNSYKQFYYLSETIIENNLL